jgi:penicillin-binding protein 2
MFLLLLFGIINLQVLRYRDLKELSNKNCIRLVPQAGARGRILDTEGDIIISSKLSYDVMILPQDTRELERVLIKVSRILGVPFDELKQTCKSEYIASSVPIAIARNIDIKKAIALEEIKTTLPGIIIQPQPLRNYPYRKLGAHIIGYLSEIDRWRLTKLEDYGYNTKDIVGFGGVEEKYDYYLRQEEGGLSVEVDSRGRLVRVLGFRPPRNGKDIQLTLNLKVQKIVEDSLQDRKGCVIIMDPYSGAIIAMASSPSFNPSLFVNKAGSSISGLFRDSDAPLINRAISATYPAGSIFKVIVASAALETGKINLVTSFLCQGNILVGRQEFKCWDTHGQQNLLAAITHSCNAFFYRTGLLVGAQTIHDYALKFGLSRPTFFELPYETNGFIPSPLWRKINTFKNWYDGDTANLSIGQGDVLVTPLQITRMMAVFANGGYLVRPYIVKSIDGRDVSGYHKKIIRCPIKTSTVNYIREGLKNVISDPKGTGNVLSGLTVSVAGKTGTAQAPPGQPHAWFVGFSPYKNPKFVICVLLERGGPGYYSCLVAKQIIEALLAEGLM